MSIFIWIIIIIVAIVVGLFILDNIPDSTQKPPSQGRKANSEVKSIPDWLEARWISLLRLKDNPNNKYVKPWYYDEATEKQLNFLDDLGWE